MAIKSHCKGSYDKQNLTFVIISYEIYETRRRLVLDILYDLTHLCKILYLSYEVAVIQWMMSCLKNYMTTRVITFSRVHVTSLTAKG